MNKRLAYCLTFGLGAVLFLTACAGVISGQVDMPMSGNPLFGPPVDVLSVPEMAVIPAAREMALTTVKMEPEAALPAVMPSARALSAVQAEAGMMLDAQEFGCGPGH